MSLACLRRAVRGRPNAATARLTLATLDGEPLASLRAPSLEDLSSTLRLHPLTEAVRLLPSARVWLERPPHRETPSVGCRTFVVYRPHFLKSRRATLLRAHFAMWYGAVLTRPVRFSELAGDTSRTRWQ